MLTVEQRIKREVTRIGHLSHSVLVARAANRWKSAMKFGHLIESMMVEGLIWWNDDFGEANVIFIQGI
jgi:hypothetical protein